jgi:hypothetical protein
MSGCKKKYEVFFDKQVREITIEIPKRDNFANLPKGDPLESPNKFLQDLTEKTLKQTSVNDTLFTKKKGLLFSTRNYTWVLYWCLIYQPL